MRTDATATASHASRSWGRTFRALATALLVTASLTVMAAPPADAVTCIATTKWTDTSPPSSETFTIPSNSDCNDMNAAYNYDHNDYIKGWYKSGSTWYEGSQGWVWMTTADDGWEELILSVLNGTTVRGEGYAYDQYVRYVV